ncbi:MAG: hypothetical protein R3C20_05855 [Planctomycetaceae bacterium]
MPRRFQNNRSDTGSLLASTFIVAMAVGCSICICIAVDPRSGMDSAIVIGVVGAIFLTVIALQRFSTPRAMTMSFLSVLSRNHRDDGLASQYRPRKVKSKSQATAEINQPITVDELREIQSTSANTWVPARGQKLRD